MSLYNVIEEIVYSELETVHTCLPGTIVSFDSTTKRAVIRPAVRSFVQKGIAFEIPPLMDVPVIFLGSKTFTIEFPLDASDEVLLLFSEAGIGNWKNTKSGVQTPENPERFSLKDAFAIPGLFRSFSDGKGTLKIATDGTVTINSHLEISP